MIKRLTVSPETCSEVRCESGTAAGLVAVEESLRTNFGEVVSAVARIADVSPLIAAGAIRGALHETNVGNRKMLTIDARIVHIAHHPL